MSSVECLVLYLMEETLYFKNDLVSPHNIVSFPQKFEALFRFQYNIIFIGDITQIT